MCVAAVIHGEGPSLAELTKMEKSNPDGAGLAWVWPGDTVVTYSRMLEASEIHSMLKSLPRPVMMHFRYATHGPKTVAACHPFPTGHWALTAKGSMGVAPEVLIHNGVWPKHWTHRPDWVKAQAVSDTQVAAYVAGFDKSVLKSISWSVATGKCEEGELKLTYYGRWFDHGADRYSNMNWNPSAAKVASPEESDSCPNPYLVG